MRRWSLALLLSLASPALAQEAPEAPEAPATGPTPTRPAPAAPRAARPAPASPPRSEPSPLPDERLAELRDEARYLVSYLLTGDVRSTLPMLSFPFQLEDRKYDTPEALIATWVKQLRQKRTDLVTLYGIELLPYAELEKKYGKAPARLGDIVPRRVEVHAAVVNLSGRAAILLYRQTPEGWRAFAYTD
jgi:hypothetical protein